MGLIITLCIEIAEEVVDHISYYVMKFVYDNKSNGLHLNCMWSRSVTVQIQTKINSPDNF